MVDVAVGLGGCAVVCCFHTLFTYVALTRSVLEVTLEVQEAGRLHCFGSWFLTLPDGLGEAESNRQSGYLLPDPGLFLSFSVLLFLLLLFGLSHPWT